MPKTHLTLSTIFSFLLLWTCFSSSSSSSPSTDTFVYGGCSHLKYAPASSYQSNINSLLTSVQNSSSSSPYNNYTISTPAQDSTLYGLYQCRGDISTTDCYSCVQAGISQIGVLCSGSCGGAIQLQGCFVKYDNASFLGVPDKTIVMKKCAPPTTSGFGTDLLSRREVVLAELGSGTGSFRVGNVGYSSGMAQCVGDLSVAECTDCISEAIERLREGCGASGSGDVYLGKCYVQYTATEVYPEPAGDGSDSGDGDEAEKTWAITIGILAVVGLIIIFLSIIRKRHAGGKGI